MEKRKPRQQYYTQRAEWTVLKTTRLKYPVCPLVTWLLPERASLIPQHHDTDEPTGRYAASCSGEIRPAPVPFPNKSSDMHYQCWTRFASRWGGGEERARALKQTDGVSELCVHCAMENQ